MKKIKNVAIIAHVDHGKTTLVDQLFRQSGLFRENQEVEERMMDSMDQEKERGITITAKNGSFVYKDHLVNIIDTPGHADFGGQVERVLQMADGVLLLVDAAEGPMPQTYFVLKKALSLNLKIIVVINKIDKPSARCDWVIDQVFDLMVSLDASDDLLEFPVVYASAKEGYAKKELEQDSKDMIPIFDSIIENIPSPSGNANANLQMLISSISYSSFLGRLAVGKIFDGSITVNQDVFLIEKDKEISKHRVTKLYCFKGNDMVEVDSAVAGEIIVIAGIKEITIGQTVSNNEEMKPLATVAIDPPTIAMNFVPNDSPFSGQEGEFVTSRNIKDRLIRETLSDVALQVEEEGIGFKVSGRGELHLSVLIEKMRREGYEFQVTRPKVIFKMENSQKLEPYEKLTIDVSDEHKGKVIENLGERKGEMISMEPNQGLTQIHYKIPTRGLLGFRSEFMTNTKGMGQMSSVFLEYGKHAGEIRNRKNGVIVSLETAKTNSFALSNIQQRAKLFLGPGIDIYEGQILGENSREDDMVVNPAKGKKLTNVRASGTDDNIVLTPATKMSLELSISYINDDELVEVTPKNIRLRKLFLKEIDRKRERNKGN